jgi:predicted transcriptional regulator
MKTLEEIMDGLPAVRRRKIEKRTTALIAEEMTLRELRKVREISQTQLAEKLGVKQEQVSRIEQRRDAHISTLKRTIEAMGGELIVLAQFPDAKPIRITGFAEVL